jgi:hypothetical protein
MKGFARGFASPRAAGFRSAPALGKEPASQQAGARDNGLQHATPGYLRPVGAGHTSLAWHEGRATLSSFRGRAPTS